MRYRFVLSLLAAGLSLSAASVFSAQGAGSGWMHDVDQAMQVAATQQRPVLLFVSMDGCKYCQRMVQTTFSNPQVNQTIHANYVPVVVKKSERPDLMRELQIRSFPTTLIVTPQGDVVHEMKGYVEPRKFQQQLLQVAGQPAPPRAVAARQPGSPQAAARSTVAPAQHLATGPRPARTAARPTYRQAKSGFTLPFGLDRLFGAKSVRR
jgi:thioredoxin-related protein